MTNRQLRQYDMLVRVREFGAARRDRFHGAGLAARSFAAVAAAVAQWEDRAVLRLTQPQAATMPRAAARAALVAMLESIRRSARIIQDDQPGFKNTFQRPRRQTANAILTAARSYLRDLEPVAGLFVECGLPATVAADLAGRLAAYEEEVRRREAGKGERAAARAGIEVAMTEALNAARRLDVIVRNVLGDDAVAMAGWERSRRVSSVRRDNIAPAQARRLESPAAESPSGTGV